MKKILSLLSVLIISSGTTIAFNFHQSSNKLFEQGNEPITYKVSIEELAQIWLYSNDGFNRLFTILKEDVNGLSGVDEKNLFNGYDYFNLYVSDNQIFWQMAVIYGFDFGSSTSEINQAVKKTTTNVNLTIYNPTGIGNCFQLNGFVATTK